MAKERKRWPTRALLRSALFGYIEGLYNPLRIQQRLGYRSPVDYGEDRCRGLITVSAGAGQDQARSS